MKKIVVAVLVLLISWQAVADVLFKIEPAKSGENKVYYEQKHLTIHADLGKFLIASSQNTPAEATKVLDFNGWEADYSYFFIRLPQEPQNYISELKELGTILDQGDKYLILKIADAKADQLRPQVHGGLARINKIKAKLPKEIKFSQESKDLRTDAFVESIIAQVDSASLHNNIQHLENYGTRFCKSTQAVQAQNWLKTQFESYGLTVTLQPVVGTSGSSANVIAVKPGTTQPDKYIIIGGHYDSIVNQSGTGSAPGADDNASGTASVLEAARILSQHSFGKTIVFCAFSAEELGLYGSETYAASLDNQNIDVEAYINQDMIGYRYQNAAVHADIACPASANPLKAFFKSNTAEYVPLLGVTDGQLPMGASSDHASFNNHGYMGIYPAEDFDHYSPYIHTVNDKIGQSVNSMYQTKLISKAALAAITVLAIDKPQLNAIAGDHQANLSWNQFTGAVSYNIYRNDQLLTNTTALTLLDNNLTNGTPYTYYIKAVKNDNTQSFASNSITLIPNPPATVIWSDDFENSTGWNLTGDFQIQAPLAKGGEHGKPDPAQAHGGTKVLGSDLAGIGTHPGDYEGNLTNRGSYAESPVINCTDYSFVKLNFYRWLNIEQPQYDNAWLEIHNGSQWQTVFHNEETIADQAWQKMEYDIAGMAAGKQIKIRFSLGTTDNAWFYSGWNIDDLEVTGIHNSSISQSVTANGCELFANYPNPFNPATEISFNLSTPDNIRLTVLNAKGEMVKELFSGNLPSGKHNYSFDATGLNSGVYFYKLQTGSEQLIRKMLLLK